MPRATAERAQRAERRAKRRLEAADAGGPADAATAAGAATPAEPAAKRAKGPPTAVQVVTEDACGSDSACKQRCAGSLASVWLREDAF